MSFEAFRSHLKSTYRSVSTGQPFGSHAAGDYPSRLRRLEGVLQMPLENAPPMVLRSLRAGLRQDPRVVANIPAKVIGDIAVALRAYANFLDGLSSADTAEPLATIPSIDPEVVIVELKGLGFVSTPTASKILVQLRRDHLILYVRLDSRDSVIIHPAFEECYSTLAYLTDTIPAERIRFYHNSNLSEFPKRDNGRGLVHYGIQFGFASTATLGRFVAELESALTLTITTDPEKTVGDEILEVETEATVLARARKGQGRFRADLLNYWQGCCALTAVSAPELLRASHIKPWRASKGAERLDTFNGLLLAVHFDALFDRALITFQDSGEMLVSQRLSAEARVVFGLTSPPRKLLLSVPHLAYMHHHQERFSAGEKKA